MKNHNATSTRFLLSALALLSLAPVFNGQQTARDGSQSTSGDKCGTVVIIGAVRVPSRFQLQRRVHLKELIENAGGLTERAVNVTMRGEFFSAASDVLEGKQGSNPYVQAGDFVTVLEREPVYVTGNVVSPQAIYVTKKLTLSQGIDMVGGVLPHSKINKIMLLRQTSGSATSTKITVDLRAIRKGLVADPILQPYDLIDVLEKHPRRDLGDRWCWPDSYNQLPLRIIK